jgi:hypothetical protein
MPDPTNDEKLKKAQIEAAKPEDKEDEKWIADLPSDQQLDAHLLQDAKWNVNDPELIKNLRTDKGESYVKILQQKFKTSLKSKEITDFINNFNRKAEENNDPKLQIDPHGNNLMMIDSDNEDYSKIKYIDHGYKEGVKQSEHGIEKTIIRPDNKITPSSSNAIEPKHLIKVQMKHDFSTSKIDENGKTVLQDAPGTTFEAVYHDGSTHPISEADFHQLHYGFNKADPVTKEKMNQELVKQQLTSQSPLG